jgi:hypothetical protein
MRTTLGLALVLCGCTPPLTRGAPEPPAEAAPPRPASVVANDAGPFASGLANAAIDAAAPATVGEADGNDDGETPGEGTVGRGGAFVRVGQAPMALQRICDLTVHKDALYAAHARQPLGIDGATITRYQPDQPKPFAVAFDWNRPGEPTKGGGAGQGFLRVHSIDGRLYVPDADPPYNGLGLAEYGTEGYVFVSAEDGHFPPPRSPHFRPPAPPDLVSKGHDVRVPGKPPGAVTPAWGGAAVLPRAYHVIDAIRYRGHLYASTGSVPPKERAWSGPSPGALHMAAPDLARWNYVLGYPTPYQNGVWRLTYLTRFKGRLYAGIQDYDGRDPNSYVVFAPPEGRDVIEQADTHPVAVPGIGGAMTVRWYADRGKLYWLAFGLAGRDMKLRVTEDGDHWKEIGMPDGAGRPTDIVRYKDALVVLTERSLVRVDGAEPLVLAEINDKKSPFVLDDYFCSAPLSVYRNELYAGGQRDGALFKWVPEAPAAAHAPDAGPP